MKTVETIYLKFYKSALRDMNGRLPIPSHRHNVVPLNWFWLHPTQATHAGAESIITMANTFIHGPLE